MFQKAVPIWLNGLQSVMNVQAAFSAHFKAGSNRCVKLRITGATLYRIRINGVFAGYGPARAPHGYARVDEIDITSMLRSDNFIEIEVAGYNCGCYYTRKQLSFLCAEVVSDGECLIFTGRDFQGKWNKARVQKVMRYSFQRPFTEVWDYSCPDLMLDVAKLSLNLKYIERSMPYPDYHIIKANSIKEVGKLIDVTVNQLKKDRSITDISSILMGYREEELETAPYYELQGKKFICDDSDVAYRIPLTVSAGRYVLIDMGRNVTGFIQTLIHAKEDSHVMITFDEKLIDDAINYRASDMVNLVDYHLKGQEKTYELESFEAYGFRYAAVMVAKGEVTLEGFGVRSYQYPVPCSNYKLQTGTINARQEQSIVDETLCRIYTAAVETFSQNTLDVYMDCPTRERAGWLCDSYFTAQAEFHITGKSDVERVFMSNFILPDFLPDVPKGMLPMCYPADHYDRNFIPQWSMWYILELEQFLQRCPDMDAAEYRSLCYDMVNFFEQYRNVDGLLEKLPGWNFVEWSKANEWVQDVNYPSNMLYARILEIIGTLYRDRKLIEESFLIRQEVIKQSFNGELFTDHSIRDGNGMLHNPGDISEVCQYYAIRFGLIPLEDPKYRMLKKYILQIFGKAENTSVLMGKIEPANVLMGIYLRMEILLDMKEYRKLLDEIEFFFGGMAEHTGTLWEYKYMEGSLNHGFASYVAVAIRKALSGLK